MTAWYEQITTSPPNGQEYKKAATRFKAWLEWMRHEAAANANFWQE
jgi:hypothetical protein